ncbi:MAG TPA: hypothetical protein VKB04_11505, partial [Anaerolineales bacterium]|nr:hypothetical protein [Anaerolineales bacterium]
MPTKQFNAIAKQLAHLLFLLIVFILLLSACGRQTTLTPPSPKITQESLPIKASIQIVTSTP